MKILVETGMALGSKHLAKILSKGQRWQKRNIPTWIRSELMVPYYITSIEERAVIFVIQYPVAPGEKVHFASFAIDETDPKIPDNP